jgi:MtN3 and saliva related transmembrane protein
MFTAIVGYTAALVTTFCLVPQLYKIILNKNIEGVSVLTYGILFAGQNLWTIYGLLVNDNIVICANLVSAALSLLIIIFFNIYKKRTTEPTNLPTSNLSLNTLQLSSIRNQIPIVSSSIPIVSKPRSIVILDN